MTRYLISFDDGAIAHIPDDEWPAVGEAAHAAVRVTKEAGIWIHGGGLERQRASIVGTDGVVADGPSLETKAVIGGVWWRRPGCRSWPALPINPQAASTRRIRHH